MNSQQLWAGPLVTGLQVLLCMCNVVCPSVCLSACMVCLSVYLSVDLVPLCAGVFMRDVTLFNEGNPKRLRNGLLNFSKLRTLVVMVSE